MNLLKQLQNLNAGTIIYLQNRLPEDCNNINMLLYYYSHHTKELHHAVDDMLAMALIGNILYPKIKSACVFRFDPINPVFRYGINLQEDKVFYGFVNILPEEHLISKFQILLKHLYPTGILEDVFGYDSDKVIEACSFLYKDTATINTILKQYIAIPKQGKNAVNFYRAWFYNKIVTRIKSMEPKPAKPEKIVSPTKRNREKYKRTNPSKAYYTDLDKTHNPCEVYGSWMSDTYKLHLPSQRKNKFYDE